MEDYYATATRMKASGDALFGANQWFVSCYILGYVAECFGKLQIQTYDTTIPKALKDIYNHRLKKLSKDLSALPSLFGMPAKYAIDMRASCPTIVTGMQRWDPEKRYELVSGLWDSRAVCQSFVDETAVLESVLNDMKLDGVI